MHGRFALWVNHAPTDPEAASVYLMCNNDAGVGRVQDPWTVAPMLGG